MVILKLLISNIGTVFSIVGPSICQKSLKGLSGWGVRRQVVRLTANTSLGNVSSGIGTKSLYQHNKGSAE